MRKTIIYLNGVLTIIAVALTVIILQNADIIPKAHAASSFYGLPVNEKGEVPVKIMNSTMDVDVQYWSAGEMEVDVRHWHAGTINVDTD